MAAQNTRDGRWRRMNGGFVAGGLILAYFASPSLRLANPFWLLVTGLSLGLLVVISHARVVENERTRFQGPTMFACLAVAGLGLIVGLFDVSHSIAISDPQCRKLQQVMLNGRAPGAAAPRSGQAEAVDAFQALGCRPQF